MSHIKRGCQRDKAIIRTVEALGVMDTEQINYLFFQGLNQGERIAQRRLKSLYERGKLKRNRDSANEPYYYYLGRPPGHVDHRLAVSWIYCWLKSKSKTWEQLHSFELEPDYGILRADAFVSIRNNVTKGMGFCFVEADLSSNPFDKIAKYNKLYESEKYAGRWWVKLATRFPAVIVGTSTPGRVKAINERIQLENKCGLEFRIYLLDKIKEECTNGIFRL